jgi:WD40 repeat protein
VLQIALIAAHCLEPTLLAGAAKNVVAYFRGEHANSRKPIVLGKTKLSVSRLVPSQEPRHQLAQANGRLLVSLPSLLKLAEQEELLDASCIFNFEFLQALVDSQGVLGMMHLIELANAPGDRIGQQDQEFVHCRRLWQDALLASLRTLQLDPQQLAGQIIGRLAGLSQYVSIKELAEAAEKYASDPSSLRLIPGYECLHNPGRCNQFVAQLSSNPCGPIIVANGDGVKIVCGRDDGALTLIEQDLMGGYLADTKALPKLEDAGAPRALAYSGAHADVVAVLREDRCDVYPALAGADSLVPRSSHDIQDGECIAISEDGAVLAIGTSNGDIVVHRNGMLRLTGLPVVAHSPCLIGADVSSVCDPESGLVQVLLEDVSTVVAISDTKLFYFVEGQDVCLASESIDAELLCLSRGRNLYAVETHDNQTRLVLYRWAEEDGVLTLGPPYSGPVLGSGTEEEALTMAVSGNNKYLAVAMSHEIVLLEITNADHDTSTSSLTSTTFATLAACFTRPLAELSCVDYLFVSDDGEVASSGEDCTLCYWSTMAPANKKSRKREAPERSVAKAALESRLQDYHTANTAFFALSTAQQHALSVSSEEVLVWDLHTGHVESRLPLRSPQRAFMPRSPAAWKHFYAAANVKGTDYVVVPLARPDDLSRCDGWMLLQAAKGDVVTRHESSDEMIALTCFGQNEQVVVLCAKANSTLAAFDASAKRLALLEDVDCISIHVTAKAVPLLMLQGGELATVVLQDNQLVLTMVDLGEAHLEANSAIMCTTG